MSSKMRTKRSLCKQFEAALSLAERAPDGLVELSPQLLDCIHGGQETTDGFYQFRQYLRFQQFTANVEW
ncbi:hypothetical protein BURK2_00053 [Burkholderiales bacterium]|nr:hypothetical protein BURK2_00053 [Burkholderiales bacterium]